MPVILAKPLSHKLNLLVGSQAIKAHIAFLLLCIYLHRYLETLAYLKLIRRMQLRQLGPPPRMQRYMELGPPAMRRMLYCWLLLLLVQAGMQLHLEGVLMLHIAPPRAKLERQVRMPNSFRFRSRPQPAEISSISLRPRYPLLQLRLLQRLLPSSVNGHTARQGLLAGLSAPHPAEVDVPTRPVIKARADLPPRQLHTSNIMLIRCLRDRLLRTALRSITALYKHHLTKVAITHRNQVSEIQACRL